MTFTAAAAGLLSAQSTPGTFIVVAGDKGCLPAINTAGGIWSATGISDIAASPSTTAQQYYLGATGASVLFGAAINDLNALTYALCTAYGVCCTTTMCNSSNIIKMKFNLIFLLFSLLSIKMI